MASTASEKQKLLLQQEIAKLSGQCAENSASRESVWTARDCLTSIREPC